MGKKPTKEELVLNKNRRNLARIVNKLLHLGYLIHSTITLRRWQKKREIKKVLVYSSMFIGEVLIALEALTSIKEKYPDTTFVINPSMKSFFTGFNTMEYTPPWFSYGEKISLKGILKFFKFIKQLKKKKFDLAVDMRGDLRNNLILYLSKAPTRVGYGNTGGKYFLTKDVQLTDILEVKRNNKIAREIGAHPKEYTSLELNKEDKEFAQDIFTKNNIKPTDKVIAVIPSAGYWTKILPKRRWAEVIDKLDKKNIKVILLGAPNEKEYSEITKTTKAKVIDLIGYVKLMQSAAIMKKASLVVGSDNGAMHLAAAVGANTLTLFGPTYLERWKPYGSGINKEFTKNQFCSPCGRLNDCPINKECMTKIKPQEVVEQIEEMLGDD